MGINITNCKCHGINLTPKLQIRKNKFQFFTFPCFSPLNVSWSQPNSCETLGFLSNDARKVFVSRLF